MAVTHGDVLAFLLGWALGLPPEPASRTRLAERGLPEPYPACASITTLTFQETEDGLRLTTAAYHNAGAGSVMPNRILEIPNLPSPLYEKWQGAAASPGRDWQGRFSEASRRMRWE